MSWYTFCVVCCSKDKAGGVVVNLVMLEGPNISRLARGATLQTPDQAVELQIYGNWRFNEVKSNVRKALGDQLPKDVG